MTAAGIDLGPLRRGVEAWEDRSGRRALVLFASVDGRLLPVVQRWLDSDRPPALDLVLATRGGRLPPARSLAHLLRRACEHLRVLVPGVAHSAGTLVALAADEIVFGDLGELGPLDPQLAPAAPGTGPGTVSAEDIRDFAALASGWFDVDARDGRSLLELLCRQVSPVALTRAYRLDRAVVRAATELLDRQLPGVAPGERERVARALVDRGQHDAGILPRDAERLGLRSRHADGAEQEGLATLHRAGEALLGHASHDAVRVLGVVVARGYAAWALGTGDRAGASLRWHATRS